MAVSVFKVYAYDYIQPHLTDITNLANTISRSDHFFKLFKILIG